MKLITERKTWNDCEVFDTWEEAEKHGYDYSYTSERAGGDVFTKDKYPDDPEKWAYQKAAFVPKH